MENKKVSIIGLGLIGGSLARGLKERLGIRDITAVNRSSEALDAARPTIS
jgi:prephenate dehydrogenase